MAISITSRVLLTCAALLAAIGASIVSAEDTEKALLNRALGIFKALPYTAHVDDYPHSAARVALG